MLWTGLVIFIMTAAVRWEGKLFSSTGNVVRNSKKGLEIEVVPDSGESDLCKLIRSLWESWMFHFLLGMLWNHCSCWWLHFLSIESEMENLIRLAEIGKKTSDMSKNLEILALTSPSLISYKWYYYQLLLLVVVAPMLQVYYIL